MEKQSKILTDLINLYYPRKTDVTALDFTFGTGALWWDLTDPCQCCGKTHVKITKCDADPAWKHESEVKEVLYAFFYDRIKGSKKNKSLSKENLEQIARKKAEAFSLKVIDKTVVEKNLYKDDYSELGRHDMALFDFPYLYGRDAFDYPLSIKKAQESQIITSTVPNYQGPLQLPYAGPKSWGFHGLSKFTANASVEDFIERVRKINDKAPSVLKQDGLLFSKIMNTRVDGEFIRNDAMILNVLDHRFNPKGNFENVDLIAYVRHGATTFLSKRRAQTLHGYWQVFAIKGYDKTALAKLPVEFANLHFASEAYSFEEMLT